MGLRILKKVERIVREEMNAINAQEVLMPVVQPAELWEESGRWVKYGPELMRCKDRHERAFCLGPTHEEIIVNLGRAEFSSYKQLPVTFYQIQTKFRDEMRPRFGVMRAREFIMKDAYSFHIDETSLKETYADMYKAYTNIFTRLGLTFRAVEADTGSIGGSASHEFQVLADTGEDLIFYSSESDYAANSELARAATPIKQTPNGKPREKVATPNQRTIPEVSAFLNVPENKTVKSVLVKGKDHPVIGLILRGDDALNEVKAAKLPELAEPLTMASPEDILRICGAEPGSIGPFNANFPIFVDTAAAVLADFVCGANETDFHFVNANWENNLDSITRDLRQVKSGDTSPDGKGVLQTARGIEVGHIFQLGDQYSKPMQLQVLNQQGKASTLLMGCYGIGVSRIVAAAIEQHHDERGIVWPAPLAPFTVALMGINAKRCPEVRERADALYQTLLKNNIEVLYDDRDERPGVMFADMELIGIPHRIVVGEKLLAEDKFEYKNRATGEQANLSLDEVLARVKK